MQNIEKERINQISNLISKGRTLLDTNSELNNLEEIYNDINYLFYLLSEEEKTIAYLHVLTFCDEVNQKLFPKKNLVFK